MAELTHLDENGNARMVDVSEKTPTSRRAVATGCITLSAEARAALHAGTRKGDVLTIAQIAGITGAKKTSDLIPLCHPLPLSACDVTFEVSEGGGAVLGCRSDDGPHGRGDGGAHGRQCCTAHRVRHAEGRGPLDDDRWRLARGEVRGTLWPLDPTVLRRPTCLNRRVALERREPTPWAHSLRGANTPVRGSDRSASNRNRDQGVFIPGPVRGARSGRRYRHRL